MATNPPGNPKKTNQPKPPELIADRLRQAPDVAAMISIMESVGLQLTEATKNGLLDSIGVDPDPTIRNMVAVVATNLVETIPPSDPTSANPKDRYPTQQANNIGQDPKKVAAKMRVLINKINAHTADQKKKQTAEAKKAKAKGYFDREIARLEQDPGRTPVNDQFTNRLGKGGLLEHAGIFFLGLDEANEVLERVRPRLNIDPQKEVEWVNKTKDKARNIGLTIMGLVAIAGVVTGILVINFMFGGLPFAHTVIVGAAFALIFAIGFLYLVYTWIKGRILAAFPWLDEKRYRKGVLSQCETTRKLSGLTRQELKDFGLVQEFGALVDLELSRKGRAYKRFDELNDDLVEQYLNEPQPQPQPVANQPNANQPTNQANQATQTNPPPPSPPATPPGQRFVARTLSSAGEQLDYLITRPSRRQ